MLLGDPNTLDLLTNAGHRLRSCGDFFWSADAFLGAANALMERGDYLGAEKLHVEAEIDAHRSTDPVAIARVLVTHAGNKMQLGELATAQQMLDEVAIQQLVAPDKTMALLSAAYRSWIDVARGRFDEGIERADVVAGESQRAGLPVQFAWCRWVSLIGRRGCLRRDGLDDLLDETAQLMDMIGLPWGTAWCIAVRAELALDQGELAAARVFVDAALDFGESHEFAGYGVIRALLVRARVLRAADEAGAEDHAHDALARSAAGGIHLDTIEALELLASFAAERGDAEQAARLLGATRRVRDETGATLPPILQREIDDTLAAAGATLGDEALSEALAGGAELELSAAIAYAERGRGSRRRPAAGWRSLTPAEIQVVELVAEGCTNAEIASRLFISVPTVKTHLSHVFTKLSVSTRAELAAQAARRS
jgi:DNA-binding CsgD family transcriptional regulator